MAGVMITVCFLLGEIMVVCNLGPEGRRGGGGIRLFHSAPGDQRFAYAPRLTKRLLWISPSPGWTGAHETAIKILPSYTYGALMPLGLASPWDCSSWHHSPVQSGYTGESENMENAIEIVHVTKIQRKR